MISKEHLEELIKEDETIYCADNYEIKTYKLSNEDYVDIWNSKHALFGYDGIFYEFYAYLDKLYETKEQAEWALKYHTTRTEKLALPMWEEVKNIRDNEIITFYAKDIRYGMISVNVFENAFSVDSESQGELLYMNFTEENYIEACDLCLKLFGGEE